MLVEEYQKRGIATAVYGEGSAIVYPALGLAGEAGEVANKVKKVIRDKGGVFSQEAKDDIAAEVGDVLWYINAIAHDLGYTLEQIMLMNLDKLESRMARGTIQGSGDKR